MARTPLSRSTGQRSTCSGWGILWRPPAQLVDICRATSSGTWFFFYLLPSCGQRRPGHSPSKVGHCDSHQQFWLDALPDATNDSYWCQRESSPGLPRKVQFTLKRHDTTRLHADLSPTSSRRRKTSSRLPRDKLKRLISDTITGTALQININTSP